MKPIQPRKKIKGEMLPLMDMIFLLLVIFIFMIVQMRPNFGVSITLPEIGKNALDTKSKEKSVTVTISVTKDNKIFINEQEIKPASVISEINSRAKGVKKENISVILRGDIGANYGKVISLFTTLRENNIKEILFDINAKKDK